jgi:pantoate--beta-alanine ligase
MKRLQDVISLRSELRDVEQLGFVPSLGGLHEGHLSLIRRSQQENPATLVSLFLNPTQFDKPDDLSTYPAHISDDLALLEQMGVDYVFTPTQDEIYPQGYKYQVMERDLSQKLCGQSRPGHFEGVLTVVMKLFHLIQPERAYFGEKDYQQLKLIQAMVDDFFMGVDIIACPTIRDDHGLALSSRNKRLSPKGLETAQRFATHLLHTPRLEELKQKLNELNIQIDYLEDIASRRYAAVYIEDVRLIDNVPI